MKPILLFCLLGPILLGCKKETEVPPSGTCQLAQFSNYSGRNTFTYDGAGQLINWLITRSFSNGKAYLINYDFSRDAMGRISSLKQTITNDGTVETTATAQFSYTNGLLTSTSTTVDPAQPGSISRTFRYDPSGRMSQRVVVDKLSGFTSSETYAYDGRGNCTTYTYTDSYGVKNEEVNTYDTSKNPEQLLMPSLPFNLSLGQPWSVNVALSTKKTVDVGYGPEVTTSRRTALTTDASGYVISATQTYNNGYVVKDTYSLRGCP